MKEQVNISSIAQAGFSLSLAIFYLLICSITNEFWVLVALLASFWFFLILPVLLVINIFSFIHESIKNKTVKKKTMLYFGLTLLSFLIFSLGIKNGCYVSV